MTGEDGMRLLLKREGRVTKEGDGAAELARSNGKGGRDGEGGAVDGGLARRPDERRQAQGEGLNGRHNLYTLLE